jgi:hypothetical protein
VISDGIPMCEKYKPSSLGIVDTKAAVKEAGKKALTIGVLIGDQNPAVIRSMYEGGFLHVSHPNELFDKLGKTLTRTLKDLNG